MDTGIIGGVIVMKPFQKYALVSCLLHCHALTPFRKYGLGGPDSVQTATLSANIVSTLQAGCFFAALFSSWVADKWGRKPALIMASLLAIIGVVMQSAAEGHLAVMYVGR